MHQTILERTNKADIRNDIIDGASEFKKRGLKKHAVVVAADTLAKIQNSTELTEEFLDLAMKATVVLACRVSPK